MGYGAILRTLLLDDAAVVALLGGAAAGGRIHPGVMPQNPGLPAITYQRITRTDISETLTGPGTLVRERVQVDAWATSYDAVFAVGQAMRGKLNGFSGLVGSEEVQRIKLETAGESFDSEALLHRHRADYFLTIRED